MSLSVVIVGAGDMGLRHADGWHAAGAEVAGFYDPDLKRAQRAAKKFGAQSFSEPDAYLSHKNIDVVSVCTPTYLHAQYTTDALNADKHVLCEKPVSLTLDDAGAMKTAARKSGRHLRIGFMRRFDPAWHQLTAFRYQLGDPILAQATVAAGIRPKRLMHDKHANGGPIIDMCCHVFDQWSNLFGGLPVKVRAHGYTFSQNKPELEGIEHKALDSAHITLEYQDGTVGQIQVSWGLPAGVGAFERHTYMGPEGLISLDWPKQVSLRNSQGVTHWKSSGLDPYKREISQFYHELVDGKDRSLATIDEGIEALQTSLAVLESVRQNHEVVPAAVEDAPQVYQEAVR